VRVDVGPGRPEGTRQRPHLALAPHTTFRVGGPARDILTCTTEAELVAQVSRLDGAGAPVLVLGGGSNVLIGDAGFNGTVVLVRTRGIVADVSDCAGALVTVAAGEDWEALVARTVREEWVGLEALSGIPGSVGASPIQNIGAYGADVSQTIASVQTLDRRTGRRATFANADCGFGYRTSRFKTEPERYLVLAVTFQLRPGSLSAPVRYPELARALGLEVGERAPASQVREAVLALRRRKGMVLDDGDPDTWSAGSFFTNPVLTPDDAARLPDDAPRFPQPDGRVKTSAAWLIEHAGFGKGYGDGEALLSTKHTLALTNRGHATAADLVRLAREVRSGVGSTFGITLVPEPLLVSCEL
jgi:UDP-N-acetylmuramate dehydrogenase